MGQFCCSTCRNTIFLLVILFASCLSQDVRGNEGTCSRPAAVANANLRSKYRNTEEFTEGSEVEYDCNIGYSITGRSRNRKCLKSGNWSPVEFECELIRCTYLPHPDNGRRTDANNGAGETTRFSCNPGYTLKGPSQLICRTDGEWSPRYTPKCEPILCPELLAPRNGDIFQDTSDGVRNNYESIVQYTCNYGYTINGTTSRTINRRCEADGTWDGYNYFCDTLKCEHIEFYGGTLNYFGSTHRAEGTYVYYSCYEGYTMFPSGVDYSECMRTSLRWKPEPPKCHGNCRLQDYQPIDKYLVRRQKDDERKNVELADSVDIIHGEKIIYSCKNPSSYELCVRPNDQVLCTDDTLSDNFDTTCTNGTFNKVNTDTRISCQERRCDVTSHTATETHACYWKDDDQDGQCRRYGFKVDSQSSINIKCLEGFELQETLSSSYQNVVSSKMKCIKGKFSTEYSCSPKRCDVSNLPYNENTIRKNKNTILRQHRPFSPITPIDHDTEITYNCKDGGYELYVNSSDTFLSEFTSKCSYGQLNVSKERFPICIERRCDVTSHMARQTNSCYWKDDDQYGQCRRNSFKVDSRSSINIECDKGYELYETKRRSYQTLVQKMECIKGHFSTEYSCLPKRCVLKDLPTNKFTVRTPGGTHIEHGKSISYTCKNPDEYELYVQQSDLDLYPSSFSSICSFGEISPSPLEFPLCLEKHCEFQPWKGVCYHRGQGCHSKNVTLKSQESVTFKCTEGYKLVKVSDYKDFGTELATLKCMKGKPDEDIKCVPENIWTSITDYFAKMHEKLDEASNNIIEAALKFTCRFSLGPKNKCKDFCIVDRIENGVVTSKVDRGKVLQEVEHGLQVYTQCNEGYDREGSFINTCENGEWKKSFPQCNPKPCDDGEIVRSGFTVISHRTGSSKTYTHGTKLNIECASGYTMEISSHDSEVMTTECVLGVWKPLPTCIPKQCLKTFQEGEHVSHDNVPIKRPTGSIKMYDHGTKLSITCASGYTMEAKSHVSESMTTDCVLGVWKPLLTCIPKSCRLLILPGSRYFTIENNTNNEILESVFIPHGTNVSTDCITGYDMVKLNDSSADDTSPDVMCRLGSWKNVHVCKKRCSAINSSTVTNSSDDNVTLDFRHGEKVKIKCITGDIEATCDNGTLNGYDKMKCQNNEDNYLDNSTDSKHDPANTEPPRQDKSTPVYAKENSVATISYEIKPSETRQGCEIPRHPLFKIYDTEGGQELDPGTSIENGATVFVQCSYTYNYDDNYSSTPIRCLNGVLEKENFICPDPLRMEHKCELKNGQVSEKWLDEVLVSCDDGYLLNLIEKSKTCECKATGLDCKSVPNPPTCVPENCKIPETYDSGLTIYVPINGSDVGLSRGSVVKHGDSVYFKCPYSETEHLELDYPRLDCMKGKWLKVEEKEEWLKLNSSDVPKCRKAICIPLCENGGKCVRDDTCECPPQATGKRCGTVECDQECHRNGGKCIAPGKCGQCPDGKSGNNCQDYGCRPPVDAPKILVPKEVYKTGETVKSDQFACPKYYVLMPRDGMTCLPGGWTETVKCIPEIKYVIQIKTGPDTFAGTSDKVYVNLHGVKYSTGPLNIRGLYYTNSLDEENIQSVDITPIRRITVSKETGWGNDWQVNYVSIFVEKDDHYYVFDVNNIWITNEAGTEIELSHHPEQCVHTFQQKDDLYPSTRMNGGNSFNLGRGKNISPRACKQLCILFKEKQCNGVYLYQYETLNDCWGFEDTNEQFFIKKEKTNFFRRLCLK